MLPGRNAQLDLVHGLEGDHVGRSLAVRREPRLLLLVGPDLLGHRNPRLDGGHVLAPPSLRHIGFIRRSLENARSFAKRGSRPSVHTRIRRVGAHGCRKVLQQRCKAMARSPRRPGAHRFPGTDPIPRTTAGTERPRTGRSFGTRRSRRTSAECGPRTMATARVCASPLSDRLRPVVPRSPAASRPRPGDACGAIASSAARVRNRIIDAADHEEHAGQLHEVGAEPAVLAQPEVLVERALNAPQHHGGAEHDARGIARPARPSGQRSRCRSMAIRIR